jgi:uncharacterized protein (TIGR03083 family)
VLTRRPCDIAERSLRSDFVGCSRADPARTPIRPGAADSGDTVDCMSIDFLAHLRSESHRFVEVLTGLEPTTAVPTCPDWTAADLVWHLGEVQTWWGTIVRERLDDPAKAAEPERPAEYRELLAFYRAASAALVDALAGTSADTAVWTWFDADQSAGFVRRRQAHEALIHRIDAELTAGVPVSDIDRALATDGVQEVLEWMYGGAPKWATTVQDGATGRLRTNDTGSEWLVQLGRWSGHSPNSGKDYTDRPFLRIVTAGEPSFEISGTARDLDAWLWNRPTVADVARSGDTAPFETIIRAGVQ